MSEDQNSTASKYKKERQKVNVELHIFHCIKQGVIGNKEIGKKKKHALERVFW